MSKKTKTRKNKNLKTPYRAILDMIKSAKERQTIAGKVRMLVSAAYMIGSDQSKLTDAQLERLWDKLDAVYGE